MDNTNDACMYMFTKGQMLRVHSLLNPGGARHSLVADSSLTVCVNSGGNLIAAADRNEERPKIIPGKNTFRLRPNPANGKVELVFEPIEDSEVRQVHLAVFNAAGKEMFNRHYTIQPMIELETNNWPPGIYFVRSQIANEVKTQQLVISR